MRKRVHTVLCWLLAISMVWLPFSVTANSSLFSKTTHHCHEMTMNTSDQVVTAHSMVDISMLQKDCCGHCGDGCVACTGMSTCSHSSCHSSAFIKIDLHFEHLIQLTQSVAEYLAQYPNQIITPDIRPPIV